VARRFFSAVTEGFLTASPAAGDLLKAETTYARYAALELAW
jgi:hypothetical protein